MHKVGSVTTCGGMPHHSSFFLREFTGQLPEIGAEQIVLVEIFNRLTEAAECFEHGLRRQGLGKGALAAADYWFADGAGGGAV